MQDTYHSYKFYFFMMVINKDFSVTETVKVFWLSFYINISVIISLNT